MRGVYASERLSFMHCGKASWGKPRRKPESGNPTFRDCRGARGNVTCPLLTKCARLGFYPDLRRSGFRMADYLGIGFIWTSAARYSKKLSRRVVVS